MTPHLLVAISSHGFGHLAQVAPVINALQKLSTEQASSEFDLTVRASLPEQQIAWRVQRPFALDQGSDDFGMVMHDALRVNLPQSLRQYAALHRNWPAEVDKLARHLQRLGVTHLLADAPYLTLAAAKAAGIASAAICSLNWADILERCVARSTDALRQAQVSRATLQTILAQMRDAYASAAIVIRPEPAIETSGFETVTTEPLADPPAKPERARLLEFVRSQSDYLAGADDCWLVLTSMGGISLALHPEAWPTECMGRKIVYLMDAAMTAQCPHAVGFELERMGFAPMLASCDAVLTKPGYGMFVESRACGKPMLYIARSDWPESACLEDWAATHSHAKQLSMPQVVKGDFAAELASLLQLPKLQPRHFKGAQKAARLLANDLLRL